MPQTCSNLCFSFAPLVINYLITLIHAEHTANALVNSASKTILWISPTGRAGVLNQNNPFVVTVTNRSEGMIDGRTELGQTDRLTHSRRVTLPQNPIVRSSAALLNGSPIFAFIYSLFQILITFL